MWFRKVLVALEASIVVAVLIPEEPAARSAGSTVFPFPLPLGLDPQGDSSSDYLFGVTGGEDLSRYVCGLMHVEMDLLNTSCQPQDS